jgi:quinol monooxygenase YgiN
MVILLGSARFAPGEAIRLRPAMNRWAQEVRGRDGCLEYQMNQDMEDENLLHVSERWRDAQAVDVHMADLSPLLDALAGAQMEWLDLRAYSVSESRVLLTQLPEALQSADNVADTGQP